MARLMVDTGKIFKRAVPCPHCNEDYLYTLEAIAQNVQLLCHGCGTGIDLGDIRYAPLVETARSILDDIRVGNAFLETLRLKSCPLFYR